MEYPKCQYQDEDINANVCPRHTPEETRKSASKRSANVKRSVLVYNVTNYTLTKS